MTLLGMGVFSISEIRRGESLMYEGMVGTSTFLFCQEGILYKEMYRDRVIYRSLR